MRQKLQDLKLIIQNDRRIWAGAGFILVALFLWFVVSGGQGTARPRKGQAVRVASEQGSGQNEAYRDLTIAFRNAIQQGTQERKAQQEFIERLDRDQKAHKTQVRGLFEGVLDQLQHLQTEIEKIADREQQAPAVNSQEGGLEVEPVDALQGFGFDKPTVPPPPTEKALKRISVISEGDSVSVKLLTGVNAPVDGTPYPVVFKLDGTITGPDGSTLDLGEARLIAAAQGSEVDSRVLFRLTKLSIRRRDGSRLVVPVDGWVVGEDGIRGMPGRLIDKLKKLIIMTAGTSFVGALGERLEDKNDSNITINNSGGLAVETDDADFAAASAISRATDRLNEALLTRYEKLVPVVEILSGRKAAAVFSKTSEIEILEDNEDDLHLVSLD